LKLLVNVAVSSRGIVRSPLEELPPFAEPPDVLPAVQPVRASAPIAREAATTINGLLGWILGMRELVSSVKWRWS
jgi:hypothetical protein